jgi:maleate isomerase
MLDWGISPHFTRIEVEKSTSMMKSFKSGNKKNIQSEVLSEALRGSKQLKEAKVDYILFGCTTGSFIPGNDFHEKICYEIKNSVNIPATTCSTSLLEALKCLDVKNVSLITPYVDSVNEREKKFLESNTKDANVDITKIEGKNKKDLYYAAKQSVSEHTDCMLLSCTALRTFDLILDLEADLGIPVISSTQASIWSIFNALKIRIPNMNLGKIFSFYSNV